MVNIAATSKRSFSSKANVLFYVIFSSFRWRRTHSNGTGGCIFKKVGVRKTIVITSMHNISAWIVVNFFRNYAYANSSVLAQGERIPSVACPIFVTMIKEYVQTIQNHMLSSFRSKNWCVWTILNEMAYYRTCVSFLPNTGAFQVLHGQASLPGRKYISRPSRIACSLVLDPKIDSPGQFWTRRFTIGRGCRFCPTQANYRCRTLNLRY